jgi:hypothetical protein
MARWSLVRGMKGNIDCARRGECRLSPTQIAARIPMSQGECGADNTKGVTAFPERFVIASGAARVLAACVDAMFACWQIPGGVLRTAGEWLVLDMQVG